MKRSGIWDSALELLTGKAPVEPLLAADWLTGTQVVRDNICPQEKRNLGKGR
jgi:hypothetical protein